MAFSIISRLSQTLKSMGDTGFRRAKAMQSFKCGISGAPRHFEIFTASDKIRFKTSPARWIVMNGVDIRDLQRENATFST
ncbi:uncharacterized protein N7498_007955 [Penicillium cinerascens]|uniref:Uncharacterized protein n=1 Tax=Penicillium cinerascens TaxID=70096 RepID=A0A9W9JEH2_9EURO|nr:uncharacterized protein N7498_007955 [Penicillium cinerascens]KAJ5194517.1 hypothetical protein N7498_007955 [Penicillium cinerascens]